MSKQFSLLPRLPQNTRQILPTLLLCLSIFFAPFNLFYKLTLQNAYVHGLLVDYLIPKIYLCDVFILAFIFIIGGKWWQKWKKDRTQQKNQKTVNITYFTTQFFLLPLIILLNSLLSSNPTAALFSFLKLIEFGIFGFLVWKNQALFSKKNHLALFTWTLLISLFFQSIIALNQFRSQHALFDYHILGETNLENFANVAKANFGGEEKILPYGTTAHPNILAGTLVVYMFISFRWLFDSWSHRSATQKTQQLVFSQFQRKWLTKMSISVYPVALISLYLTRSLSGWLALLLGLLAIFFVTQFQKHRTTLMLMVGAAFCIWPVFLSFLAPQIPENTSLSRRNTLNLAAVEMLKQYPLSGVGLNNFTMLVEDHSPDREVVRFVQPAHHVGLLWLAETGMVGILFLFLVWKKIWASLSVTQKQSWMFGFLALLPIATLDHYFLTQQTGMFLVILTFFLTASKTR